MFHCVLKGKFVLVNESFSGWKPTTDDFIPWYDIMAIATGIQYLLRLTVYGVFRTGNVGTVSRCLNPPLLFRLNTTNYKIRNLHTWYTDDFLVRFRPCRRIVYRILCWKTAASPSLNRSLFIM